jgi:hypothetical protein
MHTLYGYTLMHEEIFWMMTGFTRHNHLFFAVIALVNSLYSFVLKLVHLLSSKQWCTKTLLKFRDFKLKLHLNVEGNGYLCILSVHTCVVPNA